jgi:hypothetical protein
MKPPRYQLKATERESVSYINNVLRKIKRIEPKIHSFHCSCPTFFKKFPFSADDFEKEMEPWEVRNISKSYYNGLKYEFLDKKIKILYNPKKRGKQKKRATGFYIILQYPTPYILLCLLEKFKNLNVSKVEYTIDFFCSNPSDVRELYYLYKKYLLLKYKGDKYIEVYEPDPEKNYTIYLSNNLKVYERGDDNPETYDEGWLYNAINRLRLEFTATKHYLKNILKIKNFNDFIADCKTNEFFDYLFKNRLFFMEYADLKKSLLNMPIIYKIGTYKKYHDFLMYYKFKKKIAFDNLSLVDDFDNLIFQAIEETKKYAEEWKDDASDYKKIMSKGIS